VQQNDLRGFTRLNSVCEYDVCVFGPLPKLRGQRTTIVRMRAEALIQGYRLKRHEFRAVLLTERQRELERITRRLREINGDENAGKLIHDGASKGLAMADEGSCGMASVNSLGRVST
jgi:hypothetical protein